MTKLELPQPSANSSNGLPLFQDQQRRAEALLLDLADYIYVHTSLKPISKVLFFLSRLLLLSRYSQLPASSSADEVCAAYGRLGKRFALSGDDYKFDQIVFESESNLERILNVVQEVCGLTAGSDSLGLAFNTLIRGKFEAGEGLGTHLTPEEVVNPMIAMALASLDSNGQRLLSSDEFLFGDISGGTGRFIYALMMALGESGKSPADIAKRCYVFDQSRLSIDLGKINFWLQGLTRTHFELTTDSITDSRIRALHGRFLLLATNPPFGANKYRWAPEVSKAIDQKLLFALGLRGTGDRADPAEVFTILNLELLAPGGVLAVVLPDGVVCSERFKALLEEYELHAGQRLDVRAVVSLPVATFSLGGTVAKTSFLIIKKLAARESPLGIFVASAKHVGFLKKGNLRVSDPAGNEIPHISKKYISAREEGNRINWHDARSLSPAWLIHHVIAAESKGSVPLSSVAEIVRDYAHAGNGARCFHISILDIDETGFIDLVKACQNQPITKSVSCRAGDVLISCLNPKIWRVAVIPALPGVTWTCSPEFAVIRPKDEEKAWPLFLDLSGESVRAQVIARAKGTSSSRQRVPKMELLGVAIGKDFKRNSRAKNLKEIREQAYALRVRELELLGRL